MKVKYFSDTDTALVELIDNKVRETNFTFNTNRFFKVISSPRKVFYEF